MSRPTTPLDALSLALKKDPGRPLVTYYGLEAGERVELSVTTFDNWVSKIANFVDSELGLGAGDEVVVDLPPHWQTMVSVVGCWAAGLSLQTRRDARTALRVVGPAAVSAAADLPADDVLACSLRPLGARFTDALPPGWTDFSAAVPPQPDALLVATPPASVDTAVAVGGLALSHGDAVAAGRTDAERIGLEPGGRLVTDLDPAGADSFVTALLAPLAVGASVVLVSSTTSERRTAIADQERGTVVVWKDS